MSYAHVDGLPGYAEEDEEPAWKLQAELDKINSEMDELQSKLDELQERLEDTLRKIKALK